jgi:tetratricopeptide (TPR) repeat protein
MFFILDYILNSGGFMKKVILNHISSCILLFISLIFFISNPALAEVKTFIKDYVYQAGDEDSKNSSRTIALREVKRLLLEELGTYLESITEVQNFHLTKDQITTLTAGIVSTEIISERWDIEGLKYYLKAKISADPASVVQSIDKLRQDREKTKELEDIRKRADALLRENERLKEELKTAKGAVKERKQEEYTEGIKELSAIEWFENGKAFGESGNHNEAINAYSRAIELNPKLANAYNNRGVAYYHLGNHQQAIRDYDKAIELNPKGANAYNNRGAAYNRLGNYQQAIRDFDKAIELNPKGALAYVNRGAAYGMFGKPELAINDWKIAARLGDKDTQDFLRKEGIKW